MRKNLYLGIKEKISPLLSTVILVVIALTVSFMVTYFRGATGARTGIDISLEPKIYSPKSNIGILNEENVFQVFIKNYENYTQKIKILGLAENNLLINETLNIGAKNELNRTLFQKLIYPGIWNIEISHEDEILESYSFLVVVNKGEAETRINQWNNIKFNNSLAIIAIILSSISIMLNIIQFVYKKKI